jgi:hypothetical protein
VANSGLSHANQLERRLGFPEYIQRDSPGSDKESNWLPAPDGPIYLAMRLYRPKTEPLSVLPPGEGSWQPPGIQRTAQQIC